MDWEGFQQGACWFSRYFSPCGSGRVLWTWKWYNTATVSLGFQKFPKQGRNEENNTCFELELGLQVPAEWRSFWAFIFLLIQGRFGKTSLSLLPRGIASQGKPFSQSPCLLCHPPATRWALCWKEVALRWQRCSEVREWELLEKQTLTLAGVGGELHESQKAPHRKTGKAQNKLI